mmetsp:Transcript_26681/g.85646  ORF Transcript_26681/g.85646 Transcript_26681/m.85646 type:complete len:131 (-) Transcript_26681:1630-2022(-)
MGFNKFKNAILRAGGGAPPAPVKLNIPVTLISQPSCVMAEVIFEGSTFSELKTLYYSEFYQLQLANPELKEGEKKAFFLRDKKYGVAYEGFDIQDLYANAVVEVRSRAACGDDYQATWLTVACPWLPPPE